MDALTELRANTRGQAPTPAGPEWNRALEGHNPALRHTPDLILRAASADDVAAGVAVASRHGLPVTVQCTGHGPAAPAHGGLLIRTDRLTGIDVDRASNTVRVEAGVIWGELMTACARFGRAPLGMASVASVGVVGYTLGGGLGPLGRQQGFAADHVLALDVVDADGIQHIVTPDRSPDLYWAIRGGKFGFGVVTAMVLPLVEAVTVQATTLRYAREHIAEAVANYATWQAAQPEHLSSVATAFRFPDDDRLPDAVRGQRLLQVDVLDLSDRRQARASVDGLCRMTAPSARTEASVEPASWLRAQPPVPAGPSWARGVVVDRLDAATTDTVLELAGPESDAPWTVVELRPMSGALGRDPVRANAVSGRSNGILINTVASLGPDGPTDAGAAHARLTDKLGTRTRRPPLNFYGVIDAQHPLSAAWPPEVFARLDAVRRAHDPAGRFSLPSDPG